MPYIVHATYDNVPWVVEVTGLGYDEVFDRLLEAEKNGYVCTIEVKGGNPPRDTTYGPPV